MAINQIDTELVLKALKPIWETKPETASRIRQRVEAVWDFAKARGFVDGENPARIHRLFWAVITGLMPACLLFLEGGLKSIMSVVLIASLPILVISIGMVWAIMKNLWTDHAL